MTTKRRTTGQGFFNGPAWPVDDSSDFEYASPSDSDTFSSGHESVIADDLDLYEASLEVALTDEQINALNVRLEEFRAADYEDREQIVEDLLGSFKGACPQGVEFERTTLRTLIRQYLYGKVSPVPTESASNTRSRVVEERQETVLTDQHMSMLERLIPKFRAANTNGREKLVKEAADHIKSTWTEDSGFERDAVMGLIREHLYGKIKRGSKKSAFETRKWSYYEVVTAMHRQKIHKVTKKLSQNMPGSHNYLSHYNKARKQVERRLTDNQRKKYKVMAKEWSEKKLPPQMQQRMMTKKGPRAVKEFTTSAYKQFGMRVVVLAAFIDPEGDPSISLFDYNDKNGETSFKSRHKNWRQCEIMEDFAKWGAESLGAPLAGGSEDGSARKQKSPEVKLKRNKDGYPILPSLDEIDHHGLLYKKQLIGKFVSDIYETSIGAGKGRVPWAELQRAQDKYIQGKYLPKDVTLQQYYHLRQKHVDAILEHWTRRQAAGKVPFRFRKAAKAIRQNGRTSEENDVLADTEPREEAEEDLEGDTEPHEEAEEDPEGDCDSQAQQDLDNDQGAAQSSTAADAHVPQQTGGCTASDLPHSSLPQIQSRHDPLTDTSRANQADAPSAEDGRSPSDPAGQEPLHNETQNLAHEGQSSQLGSRSGADDVQRPPPASPNQANERQQPPQAAWSRNPAEIDTDGSGRHRTHEGGAADSPSSKRRKIDCQVDGAGFTRRRSTRDRRPTTKAAKDSAIPSTTRSRR